MDLRKILRAGKRSTQDDQKDLVERVDTLPGLARVFKGLRPLLPVFSSYVLSFVYIGIYWNNHHHLLQAVERVSGGVLWANLHLLFWLSLVPFTTRWMGQSDFAPVPTATYGVVLLAAALAYWILQGAILRQDGCDSVLARAIGRDLKGKASPAIYALAIVGTFVHPYFACALYALVALIWIVPDRRIERALAEVDERIA